MDVEAIKLHTVIVNIYKMHHYVAFSEGKKITKTIFFFTFIMFDDYVNDMLLIMVIGKASLDQYQSAEQSAFHANDH